MPKAKTPKIKIREAVGVFKTMEDLQGAVGDLEVATFPREYISVMGSHREMKHKFGEQYIPPEKLEDEPDVPRQQLIRTEEKGIGSGALVSIFAYIGAVTVAIAAAPVSIPGLLSAVLLGGLGGALAGAIIVKILRVYFNRKMERQLEKGGLLLWVKTPDRKQEEIACEILKSHGARDVHVHEISY
jgi:hypothetical protein